MELWIRSQDRTDLIKVERILCKEYAISNISAKTYNLIGFTKNNDFIIGTYATKERALEVLNEIQNILKPKYILDSSSIKPDGDSWVENGVILQNYNANARIEELSCYVYEMPKE